MTNDSAMRASFEVDGATVRVTLDRDEDEQPFVRLEADNADLRGECPGLYYVDTATHERDRLQREHVDQCRSLAQSFSLAASALLGAFEQAEQDGFCISGRDDWPSWLPSFDEAALGLAGLGGPDGFEVEDGRR